MRLQKYILTAAWVMFLFIVWSVPAATAKNITQAFQLEPGWNAVFLEVDPESNDCSEVFSDVPNLVSVWSWNPDTSVVEFIVDSSKPVPESAQMNVYYPDNPVVTSLFKIFGERAYLIYIGGSEKVTWSVQGTPTFPRIDWKPDSFNFAGLHIDHDNPPTFGDIFAPSLSHQDQDIYRMENGAWKLVADPMNTPIRSGEAFWIYCKGNSDYTGPMTVQLPQSTGLHYAKTLGEQDIQIRNLSQSDMALSFGVSDSAVPLHYWKYEPQQNIAEWNQLPVMINSEANPIEKSIATDGEQSIRLGVSRVGLSEDVSYETNLVLKSDSGMKVIVPASVTGTSNTGLWVGYASISKVSQVENQLKTDPTPTGSEFSFRLILHISDTMEVRLLKQVMQMWKDGTWKQDDNDPTKKIVDHPGTFVLFTDDALIDKYEGAALRNGKPVARRISSAAFSVLNPASEKEKYEAVMAFNEAGRLICNLTMNADDPANPFVHKYHPNQSFHPTISRNIELEISQLDTDGKYITGVPRLDWGDSQIGGIYRETISGLHKHDIDVVGTFLLHRVSHIGTLTRE